MKTRHSISCAIQTVVIPAFPGRRTRIPAAGSPISPALADERREVFEGASRVLRAEPSDSDIASACRLLLRHLAATARDC